MVDATLSTDDSVSDIDVGTHDGSLTTVAGHGTSHARRCKCGNLSFQELSLIVRVACAAWLFVQGKCRQHSATRLVLTRTYSSN